MRKHDELSKKVSDVTTYAELDAKLQGRNAQSRKLANNTYAHRRGDDIAVRLHETDVLTFRPNGTVVLDSGGWRSTTTKSRFNEFLPMPFRVWQAKGRWNVQAGDVRADYFDGMVVDLRNPDALASAGLPATTVAKEDKANRILDAKIKKFLTKDVTPENVVFALENMDGDCWMCLMLAADGTSLGDTDPHHQHLRDHMREHYVVGAMLRNAVVNARFGQPGFVLSMVYHDAQRGKVTDIHKFLTKFLRQRLRVGSTVTKTRQTPQKLVRM